MSSVFRRGNCRAVSFVGTVYESLFCSRIFTKVGSTFTCKKNMWISLNETLTCLCATTFWDSNLTWNTSDPDFTVCFEKTFLTWFPCAFLWVCLPLEIHTLRSSKELGLPFHFYNILKLLFISMLILTSLFDIAVYILVEMKLPAVDIYTPLITFFTFCLFFSLTYANIKCGIRSSGTLFMFSFLLAFAGAPQFRTELRMYSHAELNEEISVKRITYFVYYFMVVFVFFLNCFADAAPTSNYESLEQNNICPENKSSFLSRIFFIWCDKFIRKGYKYTYEDRDLWGLDYEMRSSTNAKKFESRWHRLQKRAHAKNAVYKREDINENQPLLADQMSAKTTEEVSVTRSLLGIYGAYILLGIGSKVVHSLLSIACPIILNWILIFVETEEEFLWHGYLYVFLLLNVLIIQVLLFNRYFHVCARTEYHMRSALMTAVYRKTMKISSGARKNYATGEIVNLMAVDAEKFFSFVTCIAFFFSFAVELLLCVYLLWDILGWCVLAGIVVMTVYVIVSSLILAKQRKLKMEQMMYKDKRVRLINEILAGIRVLKLEANELSFERQIIQIRNREIALLKTSSYYTVISESLPTISSVLVTFLTFGLYVLSSENNVMNPRSAFVTLSLFNIIKWSTRLFSFTAITVVQGIVAIHRIGKFLNSEELNRDAVTHKQFSEPVIIKNGAFSWDGYQGTPVLKNINLNVKSGTLVAVIGPVGSGKSALLSAILGDMYKVSGFVNTVGKLAYVPQQAWIQNSTLKNNITLGDLSNSSFYDTVLEACTLLPDLKTLPAGDQTEIGEKGINLSGGQKQRVSLARAVYSEADIYLLDDPLSAVDAHVSKHIFGQVIGPNGLLRDKTRILVTHNIMCLPQVDYIIILEDGTISNHGTYEVFSGKNANFTIFLLTYQKNNGKGSGKGKNRSTSSSVDGGNHNMEAKFSMRRRNLSKSETDNKEDKTEHKLIELEERKTGNVKWSVITYYLKAFGLFLVSLSMLTIVLSQAFAVFGDYWLSKWSNDATKRQPIHGHGQSMYLMVYGFLGVGQVFAKIAHNSAMFIGMIRASEYIHNHLLTSVLHWPVAIFDRIPCGRILNRFGFDMDTLDNLLPRNLLIAVEQIARVFSSLFVMSFNTPLILSILLPSLVLYYMIQKIFSATSKQFKRMESVTRSPIYSHFTDTITGASSICAYGLQTKFTQELEEKIDTNQKWAYSSWIAYRWMDIRIELLGVVTVFAACMFILQEKDQITAALVGLSITYGLQVTRDLYWSLYFTSNVEMNVIAIERVEEYSQVEQEAPWILPAVDMHISKTWPERGEIAFKNFQARYRKNLEPVLKEVTFSVCASEKVGVVGRTGAGKSSLTLCLFRIIEADSGGIFIDDVDISTIGLHTLRSRMTIIPQDPFLFSGTLRMNLDPTEKHSDEQIWKSLELVNLKSFIASLGENIYFNVDEGGNNFSIGQKQLLFLARALLRKTKVLILDEATAAIDFETDTSIQAIIRQEFEECTVLTIAHRLNTVLDYDRVMVLDKGRIVEFDSPKWLLESKQSMFHHMAVEAGLA